MRIVRFIVLAALAGGGYYAYQNYELAGLGKLQLRKRSGESSTDTNPIPIVRNGQTIKIASFNLQHFGDTKIRRTEVVGIIANIIRRYDIIALQEIRAKRDDILPQLIEQVNAPGRNYDFVISRRLGRTKSKEQYAFIYDRASVEIDLDHLFVVDDPDDTMHRPPFYGWFRVRGPSEEEAFTFTLVNLHTDPDLVEEENQYVDDLMRQLRDDGRDEDDVIIVGDFNADDAKLAKLNSMPGVVYAITQTPTNTRRTQQYDNIIFQGQATSEFTGETGVFDFWRVYNLTQEQALRVSDHLPVFAEFDIREGGRIGQVASK